MNIFVGIGTTRGKLTSYPRHAHEGCWEIALYLAGVGLATSGGTEIPFRPGTIIVNPPRTTHSEIAPGGFTNMVITLNRHLGRRDLAAVYSDPPHAPARKILELIQTEYFLKGAGYLGTCEDLTGVFLSYLARWDRDAPARPEVERLKQILYENRANPEFVLHQAIGGFGLSPFTIMKLFQTATGTSPVQYLITLRMKTAVHLLVTTDLPVLEISEQTGFNDPAYFSRLFRQKTGMSPVGYRGQQGPERLPKARGQHIP